MNYQPNKGMPLVTEATTDTAINAEQLAQTVYQLTEFKDYFTDEDKSKELVEWLVDETKISKWVARLLVRKIGPLVLSGMGRVGGVIGQSLLDKLNAKLNQQGWYFKLTQTLLDVLKTRASRELDQLTENPDPDQLTRFITDSQKWASVNTETQGILQVLNKQNKLDAQHEFIRAGLKKLNDHFKLQLNLHLPEKSSKQQLSDGILNEAGARWLRYENQSNRSEARKEEQERLGEFAGSQLPGPDCDVCY